MPETRVHEEVFMRFPHFRRGIVIARNMDNTGTPGELEKLLKEAVAAVGAEPVHLETDPRTAVWNETYRSLGCNPKKFPPAHLSLLKRIQRPGASIPFINTAVAIMNDNSIRGILPVGGDDLDQAGETLELRPADGNENFTSLSDPEKIEHPNPGEIIYVIAETGEVMCRRWNWRNSYQTRITESTRTMLMNIDGLGENSESRAISIRDRVAGMLRDYCHADVETAILTPSEPAYSFTL